MSDEYLKSEICAPLTDEELKAEVYYSIFELLDVRDGGEKAGKIATRMSEYFAMQLDANKEDEICGQPGADLLSIGEKSSNTTYVNKHVPIT